MSPLGRLAALLVALTACADATGPADLGPAPTRPAESTVPPQTTQVDLYLVRGELLEVVRRDVPKVPRIGAEVVKALLAGPSPAEARDGLHSAIPSGTRFRDLVIADGVARVDLSRAFEAGAGSLGLTLRLAQVACTVDQFDSVRGVRFAIDGRSIDVFSSEGIVVAGPVSCADYGRFLAPPAAASVFPGLWPFTSAAEVRAAQDGSDPTWRDPVATARAFAEQYLDVTDPATFGFQAGEPGAGEVPVGFSRGEGGRQLPDPRPTFTVLLRQLGARGDGGVWTVTGAASPDIEVVAPSPLDRISSPVGVRGRARTFEGTVSIEVREDGMGAGQSLGKGFATGGGDALQAFQGNVSFRSPSRGAGAVVFVERSAATGGSPVLRATVVRVGF